MRAVVAAGGYSQAALIKELKSRGIYTILADMNPKAYAVRYADSFYPVSALDAEGIKRLAMRENADLVMTVCADQVLAVTAKVSEELGLPCYIDYETARHCSDKQYMKRVFKANGIPTAKCAVMREFDEASLTALAFPVIIKPVDCYSSRGVRKADNIRQAREFFETARRLSRDGTVIAEEFCEGTELTVDALVTDGTAEVLAMSQNEKLPVNDRFVIFRSNNPAPVSDEINARVSEICQMIATAFGLKNSPMLVQLITDGTKINVLEFCARTGGGVKYRLLKKVCGFDAAAAVLDLTLGKKPVFYRTKRENAYISSTFLYCRPGVFDRIEGMEELKEENIISEYACYAASGRVFTDITCSGDRVGYFTVQSDKCEGIKRKSNLALFRIAVLDKDGNDMLRRDMMTEPEF